MAKWLGMKAPQTPERPSINVGDAGRRAREEVDDMLRKRGAGYNILTTETGLPDLGVTAKKKLERVA